MQSERSTLNLDGVTEPIKCYKLHDLEDAVVLSSSLI